MSSFSTQCVLHDPPIPFYLITQLVPLFLQATECQIPEGMKTVATSSLLTAGIRPELPRATEIYKYDHN
jgi:hypothetical protein